MFRANDMAAVLYVLTLSRPPTVSYVMVSVLSHSRLDTVKGAP